MTMENGIEEESNCELEHEEEGTQQSNINISDVIEVIQTTDPTFESAAHRWGDDMFSGGGPLPGPSHAHHEPHPQASLNRRSAYARIIEQPASKALRFRYECEGRSAGSIPGVNSTAENKTYPTLEIVGYKGRAVVVVSCVTKDPFPYRPHPHNLVGKDGCKKGVCTVEINSESMCVSFSNLGIQCVKKKDIEEALRVREEIRVDPFRTGFSHRSQPTSIDLNAVRLCFQVFLEGSEKGRFTQPLKPVVSDVVYDKKAMNDLVICKMSHCSATVAGGQEIILLCEKVTKEDIKIRFYEESNGQVAWESYGDFQHANVHKQFAISFKAPRYKTLEVDQPVKVCIQLQRPSDGATSEPLPFELLPLDSDPKELRRKRQKFAGDPNAQILRHLQPPAQDIASMDIFAQFGIPADQTIKMEPRDQTPSPYGGGQNLINYSGMYRTAQGSPSPQHGDHPTPSPPLLDNAVGGVWPSWHPSSNNQTVVQPIPINQQPPEHNNSLSLLDMDSQPLAQFNSAELCGLLDGSYQPLSYLPPNRQDNIRMNIEQENMTDSFTRLTTTIEQLTNNIPDNAYDRHN